MLTIICSFNTTLLNWSIILFSITQFSVLIINKISSLPLGQPASQVVTFDPMERWWVREGSAGAFGTDATPVYDLAAAKLLLSIGDDFVEEGSPVEHARGLADQRAAGGRFVYVGPRLSLTAAAADEWLSVVPGTELALVLGLARAVLELAARAPRWPRPCSRLRRRLASYDAARSSRAPG